MPQAMSVGSTVFCVWFQGGAEEPSVCSWPFAATRRAWSTAQARVLWQVRQDPQSRHKPEHVLRGRSGKQGVWTSMGAGSFPLLRMVYVPGRNSK